MIRSLHTSLTTLLRASDHWTQMLVTRCVSAPGPHHGHTGCQHQTSSLNVSQHSPAAQPVTQVARPAQPKLQHSR